MSNDLDKLLRAIAQRDRPHPDHREQLWSALRRAPATRRTGRPPPWRSVAMAAALGVLLVSVLVWQDVGTEDFSMAPIRSLASGATTRFAHRNGRTWSFPSREGTVPDDHQALAEEMEEKTAAGEMRLEKVKGLTLGGRLRLAGIYTIRTSQGDDRISTDLTDQFPADIQIEYYNRAILFWTKYGKNVQLMIEDGSAVYIGETELMVSGQLVRCGRWRFELPELGTVIYWEGAPVP